MTTALNNSPYRIPHSFPGAKRIQSGATQSGESWLLLRGLLLLLTSLFQIVSLYLLALLHVKWIAGQLYPSALLQVSLFTLLSVANFSCATSIYSIIYRHLKLGIAAGAGCCLAAICLFCMMIFSSL